MDLEYCAEFLLNPKNKREKKAFTYMHYDELIFYFKFLVFEQLLYTSYYSIYRKVHIIKERKKNRRKSYNS